MNAPIHVLVVEDDPSNSRLFNDLLELWGYEVSLAGDVPEGRARLAAGGISVVIMDIRVPGGGGEALLEEIRSDPALSELPVVAVTAFAMVGDRQRLLDAGFDDYISKPIDAEALRTSLQSAMERRPSNTRTA